MRFLKNIKFKFLWIKCQCSVEEFKGKFNLTEEEAHKRWSSSILRKRDTFLNRVENWKKVEKVAEENGIKINKNSDYEMLNGQIISIDGQKIEVKSIDENNSSNKKYSNGVNLKSVKIDTSVY